MNSQDLIHDLYGGDLTHYNYQNGFDSRIYWQTFLNIGLPAAVLLLVLFYTRSTPRDFDIRAAYELLWNCLVHLMPARILYLLEDGYKRPVIDAPLHDFPRTHAAKSAALRRLLGFDGGIFDTAAQAGRRQFSGPSGMKMTVRYDQDRPPGLGNWDNSCYQNSVLQGLASLGTISGYLVDSHQRKAVSEEDQSSSDKKMSTSLHELIATLTDPANNGKRIWTPPILKSMSSWQQQDAQEYFSKVLDEVDKEISKAANASTKSSNSGLACLPPFMDGIKDVNVDEVLLNTDSRNPLEGLLAQRVGCTSCGYSEGLSMIPFNCLTVPLGQAWTYNLSSCLDEYTKLEGIDGVECGRCTLLKRQRLLSVLLARLKDAPNGEKAQSDALSRLNSVTEALENDTYDDNTLTKKCDIPPRNRTTTIKTRQAVIARPPKSLAIHINRSCFNEGTGELKKNYAEVRFPKTLDLGPWCLGSSRTVNSLEEWKMNPEQSMISGGQVPSEIRGPLYELRAVVTHYGRHENGHYICYRRHPTRNLDKTADPEMQWWRLSDDDVMKVTDETVLNQGGVFMLFYDISSGSVQNDQQASLEGLDLQADHTLSSQLVGLAMNIPLPGSDDSDIDCLDFDDSLKYFPPERIVTVADSGGSNDYNESFQPSLPKAPDVNEELTKIGYEVRKHSIEQFGGVLMV